CPAAPRVVGAATSTSARPRPWTARSPPACPSPASPPTTATPSTGARCGSRSCCALPAARASICGCGGRGGPSPQTDRRAPVYSLLAGVRVLDLSLLAPSMAGMHLADLGADVVKVEPPHGDHTRQVGGAFRSGPSLNHLRWNRGKRSLALDL